MWRYRGFRALQWMVERLPRGWAYALAVLAARVAWLTARRARRRLEFNLATALPDSAAAEVRRLAWLNFRNHAKAYVDLMQLPRASVTELRTLLVVEGSQHLEAARAAGRGVLVVSAHIGSWETVAAIWAASIGPVSLFAEELDPRPLYEWYRQTRARLGISVLPTNRAGLRRVLQSLEAGEMVVTAIDRDVLGTGALLPFFGRLARIPLGPAQIALRHGVPLLPVVVYRRPDDGYTAIGSEPIFPAPGLDARQLTSTLLRRLEGFIRARPEQWHLPHAVFEGSP